MAAIKKETKDSSAEIKALKAELEKTKKELAEALEQIEKLKKKESGKPAAQPKEKAMKDDHEYVDLGLPSGLKWATCNIGARVPEASGDYFAWGETTTKETYYEDNCPTYGLSKSELQSQGYIDGEGNLTSQYDAATANWGGSWRMPTKYECQELIDKCKWEWVTINGVNGYKVTGTNGNSIFLPAAGYRYGSSLNRAGGNGSYWSSTPYDYYDFYAYDLYFNSSGHRMSYDFRYFGQSVRPVLE